MGLFGKSKKDDVPALPAPAPDHIKELQDYLRPNFRRAAQGVYCRTLSFQTVNESGAEIMWREAVLLPNGNWMVQDVNVMQLPGILFFASGQGVSSCARNKPLKGGESLSFIEMIEKLSSFQTASVDMKFVPAKNAEEEIKELGSDYFIAYAESEGLAVAVSGTVYPTYMGQIIGNDTFSVQTRENIKKAYEAKAKRLPYLPAALMPKSENDDISTQMVTKIRPVDMVYFERIVRLFKNIEMNINWANENEKGFEGKDKGQGSSDDSSWTYQRWCEYYADLVNEVAGSHIESTYKQYGVRDSQLEVYYKDMKALLAVSMELAQIKRMYRDLEERMHGDHEKILRRIDRVKTTLREAYDESVSVEGVIAECLKSKDPVPQLFKTIQSGAGSLLRQAKGQEDVAVLSIAKLEAPRPA